MSSSLLLLLVSTAAVACFAAATAMVTAMGSAIRLGSTRQALCGLQSGEVTAGHPPGVLALQHVPHVRFNASEVGLLFLLEVHEEVDVVPVVVVRVLVLVKRGPVKVGEVFVRLSGEPAHEALVLKHIGALVSFVSKSPEPVHHQTGDDVEEQHAHNHEETQVEEHAPQKVGISLDGGVHDFAQRGRGHGHVEDQKRAGDRAVAAPGLLVVGLPVVDKPVFEVFEAKLRVDDDHGDDQVQHEPQRGAVVGHRTNDVPQRGAQVENVEKHEGKVAGVDESLNGEEHEDHVVAKERLGDDHVVARGKQPGLRGVGHHDVVAHARQGPGQVDAQDKHQVQCHVRVRVDVVHDDEEHVHHERHEPQVERVLVPVVFLPHVQVLLALPHVVVQAPHDDGHLGHDAERHDHHVARDVDQGQNDGDDQGRVKIVVFGCPQQGVVALVRLLPKRGHGQVDVQHHHGAVHAPLHVPQVLVDEAVGAAERHLGTQLKHLLHLRVEHGAAPQQLLHALLVVAQVAVQKEELFGGLSQETALLRDGKCHRLNEPVPEHFHHRNAHGQLVPQVPLLRLLAALHALHLVGERFGA
mmetsp:Transcript_82788/g.161331  ORF Transcript_82788/g.161331 Transcript_82788/m.161331 type:complete len:581 (-) Transcript_82788:988-2730(-)